MTYVHTYKYDSVTDNFKREIFINIKELRLLHHCELIKQKLNDSLKWQCIFDTNPSPIVIQIRIMLPTCTHIHVPNCSIVSVVVFCKNN